MRHTLSRRCSAAFPSCRCLLFDDTFLKCVIFFPLGTIFVEDLDAISLVIVIKTAPSITCLLELVQIGIGFIFGFVASSLHVTRIDIRNYENSNRGVLALASISWKRSKTFGSCNLSR